MPFLDKCGSTRELVISLLSEEWPLSAKEIFERVKREGDAISYQAVHKAIQQLEEDSIVSKSGKDYQLNPLWISRQKDFFSGLNEKVCQGKSKYEIKPNFTGTQTLYFSDYSVYCVAMAEILSSKVLIGKGPNIALGIGRHFIWTLRFNFTDFDLFRKMTKNIDECYYLSKYNTPLDKWLQKIWEKGGFPNVKLGVQFEGDQDIAAQGDSVLEINYSEETKKIIDKIYNRTSGLSGLFREYFTKPESLKQTRIELKITKNPQLAELVRKQVMSYFIEPGKHGLEKVK